jgi:broad specificity phosphatase PhoE
MIDLWQHEPDNLQFPQGETFQQVQDRAMESFANIVKQNTGKTVVISTHMLPLQLIVAKLSEIPIREIWNMHRIENTSITSLEIAPDGTFEFLLWGDASHLPHELRNDYVRVAGFAQPNARAKFDFSSLQGRRTSAQLSSALANSLTR